MHGIPTQNRRDLLQSLRILVKCPLGLVSRCEHANSHEGFIINQTSFHDAAVSMTVLIVHYIYQITL